MMNERFDFRVNCWINYRLCKRGLSIDRKAPPREWEKNYTDLIELFKKSSEQIEWQAIFSKISNEIRLTSGEFNKEDLVGKENWVLLEKEPIYLQYFAAELVGIMLPTDFVTKYTSIKSLPGSKYTQKTNLLLSSLFRSKNNNKKIIECIRRNLVEELSRFEDSDFKDPDHSVSNENKGNSSQDINLATKDSEVVSKATQLLLPNSNKNNIRDNTALPSPNATSPAKPASWTWHRPDEGMPSPRVDKWNDNFDCIFDAEVKKKGMFIAAAARGRGHKQDKLWCDDSYLFREIGDWNVLIVSDGAGSAKFSRVGSQIAVDTLMKLLEDRLKPISFNKSSIPLDELKKQSKSVENSNYFIEVVGAIKNGYESVVDEINKWVNSKNTVNSEEKIYLTKKIRDEGKDFKRINDGKEQEYLQILPKDLNCTLLVSLATTVLITDTQGTKECAVVISCSIGDGMISCFVRDKDTKKIKCLRLMNVDKGEFAGGTVFVNEPSVSDPKFKSRIQASILGSPDSVIAVASMTDGVADDYYEGDSGMERLLCDLIINRIIKLDEPVIEIQQQSGLIKKNFTDLNNLATEEDFFESPKNDSPRKKWIKYAASILPKLNLSPAEALATPGLLQAVAYYEDEALSKPSMSGDKVVLANEIAKQAMEWIDVYKVRGSFDDRTLALYISESL
jgi:hypothetical protein